MRKTKIPLWVKKLKAYVDFPCPTIEREELTPVCSYQRSGLETTVYQYGGRLWSGVERLYASERDHVKEWREAARRHRGSIDFNKGMDDQIRDVIRQELEDKSRGVLIAGRDILRPSVGLVVMTNWEGGEQPRFIPMVPSPRDDFGKRDFRRASLIVPVDDWEGEIDRIRQIVPEADIPPADVTIHFSHSVRTGMSAIGGALSIGSFFHRHHNETLAGSEVAPAFATVMDLVPSLWGSMENFLDLNKRLDMVTGAYPDTITGHKVMCEGLERIARELPDGIERKMFWLAHDRLATDLGLKIANEGLDGIIGMRP